MIDQRAAGPPAAKSPALGRRPGHRRIQPVRDRHPGGPASRYTILLHLPAGAPAEAVRDALIAAFCQLPPQLRRSLAWDQGKEMALHAKVAPTLGMPVNLLPREGQPVAAAGDGHQRAAPPVLPQGSGLRAHGPGDLATVAAELNARPRKTLGWDTPSRRLGL